MKVLVFGRTGQVASELSKDKRVISVGRETADFQDSDACLRAIDIHTPDAIINAVAYTQVDGAETDADLAQTVNCDTVAQIAKKAANLAIPFVQISTDYVFAGLGDEPHNTDDPAAPIQVYGKTKHAAEIAIQEAHGCYAILRTSWVYSEHGSNFLKTMLRLSETRTELNIVADQIGGPTPASAIASACLKIAACLIDDKGRSGVYHFSGSPDVSWADFARSIFEIANKNTAVHDISTSAYPTPALRPLNSRLNCDSLVEVFDIQRPDWRSDLHQTIHEIENQ